MAFLKATIKKMEASGIVVYGSGVLIGILGGHDYAVDPVISLYQGTSAVAANEILPTAKLDASALGYNGVMPGNMAIPFENALYLELTTVGAAEIFLYYRLDGPALPSKMIR